MAEKTCWRLRSTVVLNLHSHLHLNLVLSLQFNFMVRYFFSYKTEFFPSRNNPKNLNPYFEMALDLLDCLGRVKTRIIAKLHRTDLVVILEKGKPCLVVE